MLLLLFTFVFVVVDYFHFCFFIYLYGFRFSFLFLLLLNRLHQCLRTSISYKTLKIFLDKFTLKICHVSIFLIAIDTFILKSKLQICYSVVRFLITFYSFIAFNALISLMCLIILIILRLLTETSFRRLTPRLFLN